MAASSIAIHTLNARSHIFLEVVRDTMSLTSPAMRKEILVLIAQLTRLLAAKNINYSALKNALVPQQDKKEAALVFDPSLTGSGWYGHPIHKNVLRVLHRESSRSVLAGDIGGDVDPATLKAALDKALVPARGQSAAFCAMPYVVYLNNLSDQMVRDTHKALSGYAPYMGLVDTTYASRLKNYLSSVLAGRYLQHRALVITPQEDDRPEGENANLSGYPFEEEGFSIRSVPDTLWGIFLGYKIECPIYPEFEVDTELSLTSVSSMPLDLSALDVVVDGNKFDYLRQKKAESLRRLGLLDGDATRLKVLLQAKLKSNYIYSMTYSKEHQVTKFNILLEDRDFRVVVGLEFLPEQQRLRLITLF
jgi:hypothetical protein